jgi:hypothetical protein
MSANEYQAAQLSLESEIASLINRHCAENGSDTPDFILGQYLLGCLTLFDATVRRREQWYGRGAGNGAAIPASTGMDGPAPTGPRPTIAELEAILARPDHPPVRIRPDGSTYVEDPKA